MEILDKEIEVIIKEQAIIDKLHSVNINTVSQLCNCSKKDLEEMRMPNLYIKEIIIALQINGVDLKKRGKK